jgi:hypothetical protein
MSVRARVHARRTSWAVCTARASTYLPAGPCSRGDRLAFAEVRVGDTTINSSSAASSLEANALCWRLDGYGTAGAQYDYACSSGVLTGRYVTLQNFMPWTTVYRVGGTTAIAAAR